jgi:hypothetical protein
MHWPGARAPDCTVLQYVSGGGASKSAQDTGFDRDAAQCTTGANGECKLQVEPQDRAIYGLASRDGKPGNYRLDLNLLKHNGAVAETTGKAAPLALPVSKASQCLSVCLRLLCFATMCAKLLAMC